MKAVAFLIISGALLAQGGDNIGNRGAGVYGNWLYFETPDCHLVSLNLNDGKERWHKPICDLDQYYFGSMAPLVIKNHVITGVSGDDLDRPGYIESHDPESGELQWRWYVVPMKKGDPGLESWPSLEAAQHGGGMTWLTPTYDPELNLIYVPTGNPQLDGALVTPNQSGAANWPPPSYNPETGLFYVSAARAFSVWYIYDPSDKPEGWGGNDRGGWGESMIQAIDYKTGKVKWTHKW